VTEPSIFELITGPLEVGQSIDLGGIDLTDVLDRFDSVDLTTPVHPFSVDETKLIARVRKNLQMATMPEPSGLGPLTDQAVMAEWIVRRQLELYVESDHQRADRLYILEFQGPWQYVMFGHTTNLLWRVAEHQRAAAPHGFALLNGWASPWVDNAQPLEREALFYGGLIHHGHYRERFFQMPFEIGLKIVRLVFEKSSNWRTRSDRESSAK
jgi:hypothetical protein